MLKAVLNEAWKLAPFRVAVVHFYIYAQRYLGAAKTSAYYAVNPFIGVILSFLIFKEMPAPTFYLALLFMAAGSLIITIDSLNSQENPCDSRL